MDKNRILFLFCLAVAVSTSIGSASAAAIDIGIGNDVVNNIIQNVINNGQSDTTISSFGFNPGPVLNVGPQYTYKTIQSAVNEAPDGATIIVHTGTYTENVKVDKKLTIKAAPYEKPTIQGRIVITADGTIIQGLTITDSSANGIRVDANNCRITGNTLSNNDGHGIVVYESNNQITGNNANNNDDSGIVLRDDASNNKISGNTATSNGQAGIILNGAAGTPTNNQITGNTLMNNQFGIDMRGGPSNNNKMLRNKITKNQIGIFIRKNADTDSNEAHYNTITRNTQWDVENKNTNTFNAQRNYWGFFVNPKISGLVDTSHPLIFPLA
jgi:parallel beta-helix repeat protein